jgi:succinate dehydrogenase/fumarate reductase flavoprotein subunit
LWIDGGRVVGTVCEDGRAVRAAATVIATGGAAAMWSRTSNPPGSAGVGIMLARQAGAPVADLEFVQFHPTALAGIPGREGFLITEAIRGEGARLLDRRGERFVDELAPRDEVARAVWEKMLAEDADSVHLDMRGIDPALFPNVVETLEAAGLDPASEPVPVAPAAHYMMGHGDTRPLRHRRKRLHRPPRRQPPGLELPLRVHGLRGPGCEGCARRAGTIAAVCTAGTRADPDAGAIHARGRLAPRGDRP